MFAKVGMEHLDRGVRIRFLAHTRGLARLAEHAGDLRLPIVAPVFVGLVVWVVLAALHDEAAVGPGFELRLVLTGLASFCVWAAVASLLNTLDRPRRIELAVEGGTFRADLDGRVLHAPLDRVRVNLGDGVLTVAHPGDTELIEPLQPDALQPFVTEVARLQAIHGDRSNVPQALRQRPE